METKLKRFGIVMAMGAIIAIPFGLVHQASVAALAIALGVYVPAMKAIASPVKSFHVAIKPFLGICLGVLIIAFVIEPTLGGFISAHRIYAVIFVCGLLLGGIVGMVQKIMNDFPQKKRVLRSADFLIPMIIGVLVVSFVNLSHILYQGYFLLVQSTSLIGISIPGAAFAISFLLPFIWPLGTWSTMTLLFFYYETSWRNLPMAMFSGGEALSNWTFFGVLLVSFLLVLWIGAKLFTILYRKWTIIFDALMIGVVIGTIISILGFYRTLAQPFEVGQTFIGAILLVLGFVVAVKLRGDVIGGVAK